MARGEIHVQLTVNYGEDPKMRALSRFGRDARACRDLYVQMLCYCKRNLTDGYVPVDEVGVLVYPDPPKVGVRDANRLVEVGLVKPTEGGYLLPGFLKRNKSKAQVDAESVSKAEAGRRGGKRSGEVRRQEAEAKQDASSVQAEPKHPASVNEAGSKQGASVCLNTETEVIGHRSETVPVPSEPCADAPGAELVLIRAEPPPPKRSRKPRKAERTDFDDQADELTNGYWERYSATTAQTWIAIRQIILTTLSNGANRNDVAWALDSIGKNRKPITAPILTFALGENEKARSDPTASSSTGVVDRKQQATNDLFDRAAKRAAAREEAS